MSRIHIKIYDNSISLKGLMEDYEELVFQRSYYSLGKFSLTINKNLPDSDLLQKKRFIQIGDDTKDSYIITDINDSMDESGKASQMIVATGYDLKYIFSQRNISELNDVDGFFLSAAAETVIKTLISTQCGDSCTNSKRVFSILDMQADQVRGDNYSLSAKYTDVLSSCISVASESGLGWFCSLDVDTKKILVDCFEGTDRTQGQSVNPRCLFSPDSDSLKSAKFSDTIQEFRNFVYVGGVGSGQDREIYEGFDGDEPEDLERFEIFSDAYNLTETSELEDKANSVLELYDQTYELDGEVLEKSPYVYKEQYEVGDVVTVKFNDHELDVRILDVTQAYSRLNYSIGITWGKPQATIGSQLGSLSSTVSGNSSSSDSSTNVSGMRAGVKTYDISSADAVMDGSGCMYNIIELTGTITADRNFTFYLDTTKLYGRKVYHVIISAVSDSEDRTITLSAGGTDFAIFVGDGTDKNIYEIFIDASGNVNGRGIKISDIDGLETRMDTAESDIDGLETLVTQDLKPTASPVFAGLTVDSHVVEEELTELNTLIAPATKAGCQCDIDGVGAPPIPDNPDGVLYQNVANWVDGVDGWSASAGSSTLSILDGKLLVESTGAQTYLRILNNSILEYGKSFIVKVKVYSDGVITLQGQGAVTYENLDIKYVIAGEIVLLHAFFPASEYTYYAIYQNNTANFEVLDVYIGDGTYTTGVADHSGTQNPAINTAVTPVDSKWGKLGHYNGVTSNLKFDNPVVGTTGTFRFITKNFDSTNFEYLIDNRDTDSATRGLLAEKNTENYFIFILYGATTIDSFSTTILMTDVDLITVVVSDTLMSAYADGEFISSKVVTCNPVVSQSNLFIGRKYSKTFFACGDLSFNYTTEQFTADQVKSDYNNPRKFNNEPVSQTPTAYTMSQHDGNGHTLMEFATKTATSEGNQGAIAFDATNVYFCIADSSWMKIPLQSI